MNYIYFTSESVTDGHPDKICDQIADAILDEALRHDPNSKMAVEATIKNNFVLVYGEANTSAQIEYERIARDTIREIGYQDDFDILVKVDEQSAEIFSAVEKTEAVAAGDQGIMFGYASNETDSLMPLPIDLAHRLAEGLSDLKNRVDWLLPDGKTQVTVAYNQKKEPVYVSTVLVSASHKKGVKKEDIETLIRKELIHKIIDNRWIRPETEIIINPSGAFTIAGPFSDSGTTGRKIVVDSYGGMARIGGGCFSSKDPSKVDRSGAYYSRYVARSLVAAGLADRIEIQLSYAIGMEKPLSVYVDSFGTGKVSDQELLEIIDDNFDFSVQNIINELDLLQPIYQETSNFGHFGRKGFPWEENKKLEIKNRSL